MTLLGDAAHLTPPGGDGVNLAMFDGAEVARAIAGSSDNIEAALTAYEEALFPRSAAAATSAHQMKDLCFGERTPFGFLELVTGVLGGDPILRRNLDWIARFSAGERSALSTLPSADRPIAPLYAKSLLSGRTY